MRTACRALVRGALLALTSAAGPAHAAPATRDVLVVGNNWDGTADVVDPKALKVLTRLNIVPDLAERRAEIAADPVALGFFNANNLLVGEGHVQYVDDAFTSPDGRLLYVSRPSLADVVALDLGTRADRLAREGRRLPLRPHGALAGRHAAARVRLDRRQGPRHRHAARRDRRRVRRPATSRTRTTTRATAAASSTRASAACTRRWTRPRWTRRRASASFRSSTRARTRSSSASTSARRSPPTATRA